MGYDAGQSRNGDGDTPLHNLLRIVNDRQAAERGDRIVEAYVLSPIVDCFALLYVDVDHSKRIRDVSIDLKLAVLEEIYRVARSSIPNDAAVISHGTRDEFRVLVNLTSANGQPDDERAAAIAEAIRHSVEEHRFEVEGIGQFTVSIGCALYPANGNTTRSLLAAAAAACWQAKQQGRNRVAMSTGIKSELKSQVFSEQHRGLVRIARMCGLSIDELISDSLELLFERHSGFERFWSGFFDEGRK